MVLPTFGALDVVLVATSETAMLLHSLHREEYFDSGHSGASSTGDSSSGASSTGDSSSGSCRSGALSTAPRQCSSGGNC